jgi:hypothetical protein
MLHKIRYSGHEQLPVQKRVQILHALRGASLRSTSRVCDVSINTVSEILVDAGKVCAAKGAPSFVSYSFEIRACGIHRSSDQAIIDFEPNNRCAADPAHQLAPLGSKHVDRSRPERACFEALKRYRLPERRQRTRRQGLRNLSTTISCVRTD